VDGRHKAVVSDNRRPCDSYVGKIAPAQVASVCPSPYFPASRHGGKNPYGSGDTDVFLHVGKLGGTSTHRTSGRVTCRNAEVDAPGRSKFKDASPLAATGAIRFVGTKTPVSSLMVRVCTAAAPMATKQLGVQKVSIENLGTRISQCFCALHKLLRISGGCESPTAFHSAAG
jgi:hypothetical protein